MKSNQQLSILSARYSRRGIAMFYFLAIIGVSALLASSLMFQALDRYRQGQRLRDRVALQNMLQGAADRAQWQIENGQTSESKTLKLGPGQVRIEFIGSQQQQVVVMTACVPNFQKPRRTETWRRTYPVEGDNDDRP